MSAMGDGAGISPARNAIVGRRHQRSDSDEATTLTELNAIIAPAICIGRQSRRTS